MRRRVHKDANHPQLVKDLLAAGCSVMETHALGNDTPDLVVGGYGVTALVEVKPAETKARRTHETDRVKRERLERQIAYLAAWRGGPAFVASTPEEILRRLAEARGGVS